MRSSRKDDSDLRQATEHIHRRRASSQLAKHRRWFAGVIVFQLVSVTATLYLMTINDIPNHRKRSRPAEAGLDR
jgi:hypothetical protein